MDEETPPTNKPANPPNQALILGLVLGAMALLVILVVFTRGAGSNAKAEQELRELRALVAGKQAEINAESERLGLSPVGSGSVTANVQALADKVSSDANYLSSLAGDLEKSMGDQATRLANAEATRDSLADRVRELTEALAAARAAATDQQRLSTMVTDLEARLAAAQDRITQLNNEMANNPAAVELRSIQQQLIETANERDRYFTELTALKASTANMVTAEELDALRNENNQLRYDVQRLQAALDRAELFVDSIDKLKPIALRLINELQALDNAGGSIQIKQEYLRINSELKASVIDTISFATDSSNIDFDKAESLRRLLESTAPDSFLLVVGYASKTGNAQHNQQLSSERATRVVSVVNAYRKEAQGLQAVFFGQTARFSANEPVRNQICEVWEIRK